MLYKNKKRVIKKRLVMHSIHQGTPSDAEGINPYLARRKHALTTSGLVLRLLYHHLHYSACQVALRRCE